MDNFLELESSFKPSLFSHSSPPLAPRNFCQSWCVVQGLSHLCSFPWFVKSQGPGWSDASLCCALTSFMLLEDCDSAASVGAKLRILISYPIILVNNQSGAMLERNVQLTVHQFRLADPPSVKNPSYLQFFQILCSCASADTTMDHEVL